MLCVQEHLGRANEGSTVCVSAPVVVPIVKSVGLIPQKGFDLSSLAIDPPLPPCCASTYTIGPTGNLRLFFYNAQYTTVGLQSCIVLGVLHAF